MKEETKIWLDHCLKGQKAIEEAIGYILKENHFVTDLSQLSTEERCQVKFEAYTNPVYTEYQVALETLVQVLRITGVNLND